jgi:FixJ family two-component response regulator
MGYDSKLTFETASSTLSKATVHNRPYLIPQHPGPADTLTQQVQAAPRREQSHAGKISACGNPSIMIVGCDNSLRSLLRAYLQHVGFDVIGCADLESAFRALVNGRSVHLLLVDSQILEDCSAGIRESFADQYPDLALFVISGRRMTDGTLREIKHRRWEPESKPFLLPELLGRIQASLENGFQFEARDARETCAHSDKVVSISAAGGEKTPGQRTAATRRR